LFYPSSPEEIYDILVNPARHSEFTGLKAENEVKVGGRFMAGEWVHHRKKHGSYNPVRR